MIGSHLARDFALADAAGVERLLRQCFGGPGEAALVARLRADGDMLAERVVTDILGMLGHVALSRLRVEDGPALSFAALAPLCVRADRRREGLGGKLVQAALGEAARLQQDMVVVLGGSSLYPRHGFRPAAEFGLVTPYDGPHLLARPLTPAGEALAGARLVYPAAFAAV